LTAKLLAQKDSENLTVFGSGIQAEYHIRLISQACPNIKKVTLINRTKSRAEELINKLKVDLAHLQFTILPSASEEDPKSAELISEAVKNSQIICTCTPSLSPILLGNWISPQTHICSVGSYTPQMHEFDNDLIQRSKLILVDSIDSANIEAGELISAKKSGIDVNMLELGKLIDIESSSVNLGEIISNSDEAKDLTLFKSVGIPSQDVTITLAIVQLAKRLKLGTEVEF
jgi:ornithine cyclodeaminase